ncbi:MAG: helix-turn-helix domain-containing protein [Lachnospiraceae bacterium]
MGKEKIYLISDASKKVQVESHVLRYWEEELKLPIKRNEMGHRYYTEEDIKEFLEIKHLKEQGLQLKAIRMILNDGKLIPLNGNYSEDGGGGMASAAGLSGGAGIASAASGARGQHEASDLISESESDKKAKRLQNLFRRMLMEVVEDNNQKMMYQISEAITKELDYQFRMQEEREEQRENRQMLLEEEHYRQLDDLIRNHVKKGTPKEKRSILGRNRNKSDKRKK